MGAMYTLRGATRRPRGCQACRWARAYCRLRGQRIGAGLAGVIIASRVGAGQANASVGIELTVIAAMVVGGTSIMGGEGSVARSFLGVLLLALILNGFNLLGVPSEYHRVFQGMILLIAVGADVWSRRRR